MELIIGELVQQLKEVATTCKRQLVTVVLCKHPIFTIDLFYQLIEL